MLSFVYHFWLSLHISSVYFQIIEQKEDGIWKGSLMKEGRVAKAGYFPADHVVLIDNNGKSDLSLPMSIDVVSS